MDISLPESLAQYLREKMQTGRYHSPSEIICEALQQKIMAEHTDDPHAKALQREILLGWQEAERGEFVPFSLDAAIAALNAEHHG